jgi:hypothetical protein
MSQNYGHQRPIGHPPGDMWAWTAMVMIIMPALDNSWLVHQSFLTALPAYRSVESRKIWRSENFAYQYLKYLRGSLTCRKILRYGTSHPKEVMLWIFIVLTNPSPRPGLNPRPSGPVTSTLTTKPPRWRLLQINIISPAWLQVVTGRIWPAGRQLDHAELDKATKFREVCCNDWRLN